MEFTADPPLTEVMALYMVHSEKLRAAKSAKEHARRLAPFIEGKKASEARIAVNEMNAKLLGTLKPATLNRSIGTLKKALSLAHEADMIPENYGEKIKRHVENNAREVFLTLEQVQSIADKASENVRAAIWIAIYTGMRRGEILKLRQEHIAGDLIVIPAGNTKTLKMRAVPVIDPLLPWLKFVPLPINAEGLKSGFRRAREAAGLPHVHFHDIRHSTASMMAYQGIDLLTISRILGHTTTRMSERYAHVQADKQREALKKAFGAGKPPAET